MSNIPGITREEHSFDALNYLVIVSDSQGERWRNLQGELTHQFTFHTAPNNSFYGIVSDDWNLVDQDLRIESVSQKFAGSPSDKPLATIPTAQWSISNLELWYHQLCEANYGDLNVFQGANIEIFQCSSYIPRYYWNEPSLSWLDPYGVEYAPAYQFPNPEVTYLGNYPNNEAAFRIFSGTLEDIDFSASTTTFNCLGKDDRQNVNIGKLSDPLSQKKDRGKIIPITYGDFAKPDDLMPVVLDRDQDQVPRIILGDQPLHTNFGLYLYDKVSERNFPIQNSYTLTNDNQVAEFRDDIKSADLEKNVSEDITEWDQGAEVDTLLSTTFAGGGATEQLLTSIDGELVGFHSASPKPIEFDSSYGTIPSNPAASRAWGDSTPVSHTPDSELFGIDQNYQKAVAVIDLKITPTGFYSIDAGQDAPMTGNAWNIIKKTDLNSAGPDIYSLQHGLKQTGAETGTLGTNQELAVELTPIGFEGDVLELKVSVSFYSSLGVAVAPIPTDIAIMILQSRIRFEDPDSAVDVEPYFSLHQLANGIVTDGVSSGGTITDGNIGWKKFSQVSDVTSYFEKIADFKNTTFRLRTEVTSSDVENIPEDPRIVFDAFYMDLRVSVEAEEGLWFSKGFGRVGGALGYLSTPTEILPDLFEKELNFTDFNYITPNRQLWPCAFTFAGKQKKWRKEFEDILQNYSMASFMDGNGQQNLIDLDIKPSDDLVITPDMVLTSGNIQDINYNFTDRDQIFNEFLIKFQRSPANGDFLSVLQINEEGFTSTNDIFNGSSFIDTIIERCEKATPRLGLLVPEKKQFLIESDKIRDQKTAELILDSVSRWNTSTKAQVSVRGTLSDFFGLELGDQVTFSTDFGGLPKKILDPKFMVIGKTITPAIKGPGYIELKLIENPNV